MRYRKWEPRKGLILTLFAWISFVPQPLQERFRGYVGICLAIFLLVLVLNKQYQGYIFKRQDWPLWLFLICLSAGIVSATNKGVAFKMYIYLITTFFFLFYIGKGIFSSARERDTIFIIICACSCLVAVIGILELYFGRNILYEKFIDNIFYERYKQYNPRPVSTQFNPAILGSYLLGCLPFNLYFLKHRLSGLRLLAIFSSLLCITVIILSFSRGVFLGLVALLLFYLCMSQKKSVVIAFLISLFILVTICSYSKNPNLNRFGFNRLVSGSYDSIFSEYRWKRVRMTVRILRDYPFFGIGLNHFRMRFNEYCDKEDAGQEIYEFMIPDNMYLTFLAETGVIGTFGFLVFMLFLISRGMRRLGELGDKKTQQILLISMSALIGLLVNMGAYELFYWSNPYMLFCLFCGFVQAL